MTVGDLRSLLIGIDDSTVVAFRAPIEICCDLATETILCENTAMILGDRLTLNVPLMDDKSIEHAYLQSDEYRATPQYEAERQRRLEQMRTDREESSRLKLIDQVRMERHLREQGIIE
jgi:hypothetical protein